MIPTAPRTTELQTTKAERWEVRRTILSTPEAVAALAIDVLFLLGFAAAASTAGGFAILFGILAFTMTASMTSESGLFTFIATIGRIILVSALAAESFPRADANSVSSALPITVGMWMVYLQLELAHLAAGHRRHAIVRPEVRINRLLMVGLVGLLSVITAVMLAAIRSDTERSWLWVPVAAAAILGAVAVGAGFAMRRRGVHDRRHWVPGERLLPPARD